MYLYLIYVYICPLPVLWTELSEIKILIELIDLIDNDNNVILYYAPALREE